MKTKNKKSIAAKVKGAVAAIFKKPAPKKVVPTPEPEPSPPVKKKSTSSESRNS